MSVHTLRHPVPGPDVTPGRLRSTAGTRPARRPAGLPGPRRGPAGVRVARAAAGAPPQPALTWARPVAPAAAAAPAAPVYTDGHPVRATPAPARTARAHSAPARTARAHSAPARTALADSALALAVPTQPAVTAGRLVLTRRGRAVLLAVTVLALLIVFSLGRVSSGAAAPAGPVPTVVVQPGDTLWSIATTVRPHSDPRQTVDSINRLNHLSDAPLPAGMRLVLPRG